LAAGVQTKTDNRLSIDVSRWTKEAALRRASRTDGTLASTDASPSSFLACCFAVVEKKDAALLLNEPVFSPWELGSFSSVALKVFDM
jgi:hypothetical protein